MKTVKESFSSLQNLVWFVAGLWQDEMMPQQGHPYSLSFCKVLAYPRLVMAEGRGGNRTNQKESFFVLLPMVITNTTQRERPSPFSPYPRCCFRSSCLQRGTGRPNTIGTGRCIPSLFLANEQHTQARRHFVAPLRRQNVRNNHRCSTSSPEYQFRCARSWNLSQDSRRKEYDTSGRRRASVRCWYCWRHPPRSTHEQRRATHDHEGA